jgi:hypothetical protein
MRYIPNVSNAIFNVVKQMCGLLVFLFVRAYVSHTEVFQRYRRRRAAAQAAKDGLGIGKHFLSNITFLAGWECWPDG